MKPVKELSRQAGVRGSVHFVALGGRRAVVSCPKGITVWDYDTLAPCGQIAAIPMDENSLHANSKIFLCAVRDQNTADPVMRVWDILTLQELHSIPLPGW
jgi:hypothetical protein